MRMSGRWTSMNSSGTMSYLVCEYTGARTTGAPDLTSVTNLNSARRS